MGGAAFGVFGINLNRRIPMRLRVVAVGRMKRRPVRSAAANQKIPDFSVRKCNTREIAKDSASAMVA